MRVEYDFDQMAGGVRGKYAAAWEGRTPAMSFTDLQRKIAGGESATLEFKKSTGKLNRAGATTYQVRQGGSRR